MNNKTKLIRIRLSTWKELRKLVPGKWNETYADYLDRVVNDLGMECVR